MADQHPKDISAPEEKDVIPLPPPSLPLPFNSPDLVPLLHDQHQDESNALDWTSIVPTDPHLPSFNYVPDHTQSLSLGSLEDDWIDMIGLEDDISSANQEIVSSCGFPDKNQTILIPNSTDNNEEEAGPTNGNEDCSGSTFPINLSREQISQYFHMPITQAADELKVGLTQLKKRCRTLGISRWPHRKFKSLRYLVDNVQELSPAVGGEAESISRETTHILETEQKKIEENPNLELDQHTTRLRNRCYKATYKKRRRMGEGSSNTSNIDPPSREATDDDEQGKMRSKSVSEFYD